MKYKLRIIEIMLILLVGIITLILNPSLQLLAISFVIISAMRGIFIILEDSNNL